MTGRRGRRRKQLLDDLKEKKRYWKLKEEALYRTGCRTRFGRGYGPVVRQTRGWMNTSLKMATWVAATYGKHYYVSNIFAETCVHLLVLVAICNSAILFATFLIFSYKTCHGFYKFHSTLPLGPTSQHRDCSLFWFHRAFLTWISLTPTKCTSL
jgi:hypothetical protein